MLQPAHAYTPEIAAKYGCPPIQRTEELDWKIAQRVAWRERRNAELAVACDTVTSSYGNGYHPSPLTVGWSGRVRMVCSRILRLSGPATSYLRNGERSDQQIGLNIEPLANGCFYASGCLRLCSGLGSGSLRISRRR